MKDDNIIAIKTKTFAIRIIHMFQFLSTTYKGTSNVLFSQLLKSGTSIGANVHEAINGQSKKDFEAKLNIALKEASETEYWIDLLFETGYIKSSEYESIHSDCVEIIKILTAILNSSKKSAK